MNDPFRDRFSYILNGTTLYLAVLSVGNNVSGPCTVLSSPCSRYHQAIRNEPGILLVRHKRGSTIKHHRSYQDDEPCRHVVGTRQRSVLALALPSNNGSTVEVLCTGIWCMLACVQ